MEEKKPILFKGGIKLGEITKKTLLIIISSAVALSGAVGMGIGIGKNLQDKDSKVNSSYTILNEQRLEEIAERYSKEKYKYDDLSHYVLIKYKDRSGKLSSCVIDAQLRNNLLFVLPSARIRSIETGDVLYKEENLSKTEEQRWNTQAELQEFLDELSSRYVNNFGELVSSELFLSYMIEKYGIKSYYTAVEIDDCINEITKGLAEEEKALKEEERKQEEEQKRQEQEKEKEKNKELQNAKPLNRLFVIEHTDINGQPKLYIVVSSYNSIYHEYNNSFSAIPSNVHELYEKNDLGEVSLVDLSEYIRFDDIYTLFDYLTDEELQAIKENDGKVTSSLHDQILARIRSEYQSQKQEGPSKNLTNN